MFNAWLIREVWYNIDIFTSHCPGLETIGYKEVVEHLERKISLETAIALIQQHSRNYAKRQITWNKRYEQS
jgi:tRNA dimethylallyltransferase